MQSSTNEKLTTAAGFVPRVSVGMPVYNGERYTKEAIESLLAQTFPDFELVISDNASTDRTEEMCRTYAAKDSRIRYYRNRENIGASRNFTRVVELGRAPYFKWAAHDDVCAPKFLEKCVEVLDREPNVVLCYPRSAFIDQCGQFIADHYDGCNLRSPRPSERVRQYFVEGDLRCHPMFGLIRRDALKRTTLIAPNATSDMLLLFQLALLGEFSECPERLFFCREHPERACRKSRNFAEVVAWHDPKKGARVQLPRWRLVFDFLRSIAHAGIEPSEARGCYLLVLKWCRWHSSQLFHDLVMAVRQITAIALGLPPVADRIGFAPAMRTAEPRGAVQVAPGGQPERLRGPGARRFANENGAASSSCS